MMVALLLPSKTLIASSEALPVVIVNTPVVSDASTSAVSPVTLIVAEPLSSNSSETPALSASNAASIVIVPEPLPLTVTSVLFVPVTTVTLVASLKVVTSNVPVKSAALTVTPLLTSFTSKSAWPLRSRVLPEAIRSASTIMSPSDPKPVIVVSELPVVTTRSASDLVVIVSEPVNKLLALTSA